MKTTKAPVHYAWIVTVVTSVALLAAAGVRTAPQVLILPLHLEFGWSRAEISFAIAISILWFGLGGPVAGILVDRFGLRRVMGVGLVLVASGLTAMLTLNTLWQLHLFWGLVVGVGTGMLTNVLGAIVAQRWFVKHRGLVVGLFGGASAAGQLIFLPTMIALTTWQGWRGAIAVAAAIFGVLILPVILLMREHPADVRQRPYGEGSIATAQATMEATQRTPLRAAIRTRDFWLLAASFFVCGYTTNGLIGTHLLPHALEHGFAADVAGRAIALMGALNLIGTLGSGWLSDRVDSRWLLSVYYGLRAGSIALLPFVQDWSGLVIFAVVYGLDWIATVPPTINLTAQRFGRASVGVLYGWIFFSHMVGAAVAAYLGGALRDMLGDYTLAFLSAAVLGFIAAGLSLGIGPSRAARVAPTQATAAE
ncbi:MAG: MFS transporter [Chloroflexi bacterium]|nr:MFS transporter [Chloroflexota bacterium]